MRLKLRRWLAVAVTAGALGIAVASLLTPAARAETTACPHNYCQPTPEPRKTPKPPEHTPQDSIPAQGSVQAVVAPTAPPFDDTKATPGPITGTMVTPQAQLNVPLGSPSVTAQPQPEGGLTALLVVGGILALLCLGTFTVAVALK